MSDIANENNHKSELPMDPNKPEDFARILEQNDNNATATLLGMSAEDTHASLTGDLQKHGLKLDRFLGAGVLSLVFSLNHADGTPSAGVVRLDTQELGKPLENPFILQSPLQFTSGGEAPIPAEATIVPKGENYKSTEPYDSKKEAPIDRLNTPYTLGDGEAVTYRELLGRIIETLGAMYAIGGDELLKRVGDIDEKNMDGAFITLPDPDKQGAGAISYEGKPVLFLSDVSAASESRFNLGQNIHDYLKETMATRLAQMDVNTALMRKQFPNAENTLMMDELTQFDKEQARLEEDKLYREGLKERIEYKRERYQAFIDEHFERGHEMAKDPKLLAKIERLNEQMREEFTGKGASQMPADTLTPREAPKQNRVQKAEGRWDFS